MFKLIIDSQLLPHYLQFTSSITAFWLGGVRLVLLAIQTSRAFKCWRPIFGYDKWFTVTPSCRASNDSSITVLSKYQVTFGLGRPIWWTKNETKAKIYQNGFIQALIFHWQFFFAALGGKMQHCVSENAFVHRVKFVYKLQKNQSQWILLFFCILFLQYANFNFKRICIFLWNVFLLYKTYAFPLNWLFYGILYINIISTDKNVLY